MMAPSAPVRIAVATITTIAAVATVTAIATGAAVVTVVAAAEVRLRLTAGDERRQAIDVAIVRTCRRLRLLIAIIAPVLLLARRLLLLAHLVGLLVADRVGLRLAHLAALLAAKSRELGVGLVGVFVAHVVVHALWRLLLLRLVLAELFLRRCNDAEIMLGVLVVVLRPDYIAGLSLCLG